MLFSGGACSRRVSLFKAVLFSAKMRKAQEREKELGVGRERENFVVVVVLFCVECRGREERGKKKICLILKVARQTKKQEVVKKHNKKKEEKRQKARALHEVFMLCFVLFKTME